MSLRTEAKHAALRGLAACHPTYRRYREHLDDSLAKRRGDIFAALHSPGTMERARLRGWPLVRKSDPANRIVIGRDLQAEAGLEIRLYAAGAELVLADGVTLNRDVHFEIRRRVTIGTGSGLSTGVTVFDSDLHGIDGDIIDAPVTIGEQVWVGTNAMIMKGVTIGDGAIVAAGSVVTRDVAAHTIVAGVPARQVGTVTWWSEQRYNPATRQRQYAPPGYESQALGESST